MAGRRRGDAPPSTVSGGLTEDQLQRREYNRRKQQRYIDNQKHEATRLKTQIRDLEGHLQRLAPFSKTSDIQRMLSWEDVAEGLRSHLEETSDENRSLRGKRESYVRVIKTMAGWIAASKRMTRTPCGRFGSGVVSLNHVRLVANADCRRHGFDWITQILYHNSSHVFQTYQFPSCRSLDVNADFHMDFSDGLQYVWRLQVDVQAPMEQVAQAVRDHFVTPVSSTARFVASAEYVDTELLEATNMTYVRKTHRTGNDDDVIYQNLLYREFNETDRVVVVGQTIPDDEACPRNEYDLKSIIWIAVERTSAAESRIRILRTGSHMYTQAGGDFSLEQEARLFGYDLSAIHDDSQKESQLARHFHVAGVAATKVYSQYLENALAAIDQRRAVVRPGQLTTLELVYQKPTNASPHWTWLISNRNGTIDLMQHNESAKDVQVKTEEQLKR
ncbi:Aste57867_20720 [Aphanomyces stellatus]|uniref:Aste57867_20720 protein n=1 Tax=Aphanomyces stellatus TaxID=120398 RepID=A0A485LFS7_9STRA|nr:hypothetical protein As57867_020652 [Aphanomyces stellatus]VFT97400.1 Aste57867_20720 [Aphanomyces stellatus]